MSTPRNQPGPGALRAAQRLHAHIAAHSRPHTPKVTRQMQRQLERLEAKAALARQRQKGKRKATAEKAHKGAAL